VQLLSVAHHALPAHLAHGDIQAPPSVRTAADCLTPQPPPGPVAGTGTTDARGVATFVIPDTNVIARIGVTDATGAPVAGAIAQIMVAGDDYFVIVADGSGRLAPAAAEGALSEARPGSALQLVVNLVMQTYNSTFAGVQLLRTTATFPNFVRSHFSPDERCFTEAELRSFLSTACSAGADVATGVLFGMTLTLIWSPTAQAVDQLTGVWTGDVCDSAAQASAAMALAGKTLAVKKRVYNPPLLPGIKIFPVYFEDLGPCGGGCCISNGKQCEIASDATRCNGTYWPDVPCTANPCKTGACCDPNFGCTLESEIKCLSLGRTYKGDDTVCTPNPCPLGACCNPSTGCTVMPPLLCQSLNGTYLGDGTSCLPTGNEQPVQYTLKSSRDLGGASVAIPFPGGRIRATITIPSNMIRGSGTTGDCGRGDARVELRLCPAGSGCTGSTWQGGHHIAICHDFAETLTWEIANPSTACSTFSFNAITEKESTAEVEILPP
jgi:hypothetical protein